VVACSSISYGTGRRLWAGSPKISFTRTYLTHYYKYLKTFSYAKTSWATHGGRNEDGVSGKRTVDVNSAYSWGIFSL
jgi:hypothetical protein